VNVFVHIQAGPKLGGAMLHSGMWIAGGNEVSKSSRATSHQNRKLSSFFAFSLTVEFGVQFRHYVLLSLWCSWSRLTYSNESKTGNPVFLKDLWPSQAEIRKLIDAALKPEVYPKLYGNVDTANPK
jgi:hypothetical protein